MVAGKFIYALAGRATLVFDWVRPFLAKDKRGSSAGGEFDKTGLVATGQHVLPILYDDGETIFPQYDSLAHSFWRSQEFSLFLRHKGLLSRPLLDFGCGDGSFASVLFPEIDYGIDSDPEALQAAERYGIYKKTARSTDSAIPLGDGSVRSAISNSVLEHLADLDAMLRELSRVLEKGGTFIFTVPVDEFGNDVARYFGRRAAERMNAEYFHRNLLAVEAWKTKLEASGFSLVTLIPYQPDWFTFWYRMFRLFGRRGGLGRFFPNIGERIFLKYQSRIMDMVRTSVRGTRVGGNIFVVARKR